MQRISALAILSILTLAGALAVEAWADPAARESAVSQATNAAKGEVTSLRDGCELLVDDPDSESETVDYWAAVCHGYAIAARDYTQIVTGFYQKLEGKPLAVCIEPDDVSGREVARVFVEYVDRYPEASGQPAVAVMLAAITDHWCAELLSRTTRSSEQVP